MDENYGKKKARKKITQMDQHIKRNIASTLIRTFELLTNEPWDMVV
jgi:hypothetical protein